MTVFGADLVGLVSAVAGAELEIHAAIQFDGDDPDGLRIDADIDDTPGAMALGQAVTPQIVAIRAYVDEEEVDPRKVFRISASRSLNDQIQRWGFSTVLSTADGEFGENPITERAPSLCKKAVDIFGVYKTSTGIHLVPLITNGIVDNEEREFAGEGAIARYVGVDSAGRYDGETVDLVLPPGHGLTAARVARMLAERAGFEDISFEEFGEGRLKEFQVADAQVLPPIQDLADVGLRRVIVDRAGALGWRKSGAPGTDPVHWNFTSRHIRKGSIRIVQPGDVVTQVDATGEGQRPAGVEADVSSQRTVTVFSLNGPHAPKYRQNGDGSFTANTVPDAPANPIKTRYEVYDTVKRGGQIIYERARVWEYRNPETSRYIWTETSDGHGGVLGEWTPLANVYVEDNALDDGPAFAYHIAAWTLVEDTETWSGWYAEGLQGGSIGVPIATTWNNPTWPVGALEGHPDFPLGHEGDFFVPPQGPWYGVRIFTFLRSKRWAAPRRAVRERDVDHTPYPPWEDTDPDIGTEVLGNKEAAIGGGEAFRVVEEVATFLESDRSGFLTNTYEHHFGYQAREGFQYLYGDDREMADEFESFRYIGTTTVSNVADSNEGPHTEFKTFYNLDGAEEDAVTTTGIDGYLPAIERIPDEGKVEATDDLTQSEIDAAYQRSLRTEAKSIAVSVHDEELEVCHPARIVELQAPYAENEDELEAMAWNVIDASSATQISFDLAGANFYVEPGDLANVELLPIGLDHVVRIEDVSWEQGPTGPITTQVSGRIFAREAA